MKKTVLFLLALTLMVGVSYAGEAPLVPEITGGDELVQEKGRFQETWVHPDADMSKYSKLYLWQSLFQFREGGETTATAIEMSRRDLGPFVVSDESKEKFERVVSEAVVKELGRSKIFEVVEDVGPDTLLVRCAMLDIVSDVPPNVGRFTNVYLAAVGEATIVFELIDAETGVVQARVAERRRIQPQGRMNQVSTVPANAASVWNDVERWARNEAQTLRRELEKSKKKSNK